MQYAEVDCDTDLLVLGAVFNLHEVYQPDLNGLLGTH